jgi:putative transposase
MARFPRVVAPGVPHHITQRGNARQYILDRDADRLVYVRLLQQYSRIHDVALLGYCLMSNHVHLIAVPPRADSLHLALKHVHGRYAAYFNTAHASTGHVWQGRFYSCPLDEAHLWVALRYVELNPVRAGLAANAADYVWSSASAHCATAATSVVELAMTEWRAAWTARDWLTYLEGGTGEQEAARIRRNTHSGRPLGGSDFVSRLEAVLNRPLAPRTGGRPPKRREEGQQIALGFTSQ